MPILLMKLAIIIAAALCVLILYWLVNTDVEREMDEEEKELFGD